MTEDELTDAIRKRWRERPHEDRARLAAQVAIALLSKKRSRDTGI